MGRRFEVIDEERQAALAFGVFDHCGCKPELTMPDGRVVKLAGFNRPSSIRLAEAFSIQGDLIQRVEAVGACPIIRTRAGIGRASATSRPVLPVPPVVFLQRRESISG